MLRDELLRNIYLALRGVRRHLREASPRINEKSAFSGTMRGEQGCARRAISSVLFMLTVLYGWISIAIRHARQSERPTSSLGLHEGRDEVEKGRRPVANGWNKRGRGAVDERDMNGL